MKHEIKKDLSLEQMQNALEIWDQTVGCSNCMQAWWAENYTEDPTMFHDKECPAYGRRDVAEAMFNLEFIEKDIGRRVGIENGGALGKSTAVS